MKTKRDVTILAFYILSGVLFSGCEVYESDGTANLDSIDFENALQVGTGRTLNILVQEDDAGLQISERVVEIPTYNIYEYGYDTDFTRLVVD